MWEVVVTFIIDSASLREFYRAERVDIEWLVVDSGVDQTCKSWVRSRLDSDLVLESRLEKFWNFAKFKFSHFFGSKFIFLSFTLVFFQIKVSK